MDCWVSVKPWSEPPNLTQGRALAALPCWPTGVRSAFLIFALCWTDKSQFDGFGSSTGLAALAYNGRPAACRKCGQAIMTEQQSPLADQVHQWLRQAGITYYLCDQCNGLHLSAVQLLAGVVESRLFVEDWGLLISTEFLVRPTALLPLAADLGRLNINYPTLKLFLDIVDDALPQLAAGSTVLSGAGLDENQFALFVSTTQDMTTRLAAELSEIDFLLPDEQERAPAVHRFH